MKPFKNLAKGENRNMTHFSLPQQPETEQESRSTQSSQMPKHWRLFNRVQEVSRVLSQFALVVKESVNKCGYLASSPKQLGEKNESEREEEVLRGGTLTTHSKCHCQRGRRWGIGGGVKTKHSKPQQVCNHLVKANSPVYVPVKLRKRARHKKKHIQYVLWPY